MLVAAEEIDLADAQCGVFGNRTQQRGVTGRDRLRRLGTKQIEAVAERSGDADRRPRRGMAFDEVERQVEPRMPLAWRADPLERRPCVRPRVGLRPLESDQHLEQRITRERAARSQRLHDPLERNVAVGARLEHATTDTLQQLVERGVAGRVDAQHDGVDEEPDDMPQGHG